MAHERHATTRGGVRRVLLTGAAGGVAGLIRPILAARYPVLRLSDMLAVAPEHPGEEFVLAPLDDAEAVARAAEGMDGIVHLGAVSKEASLEALIPANIVGTYNVLEAARRHGVKRFVLASTMHVMGFYEHDAAFDENSPIRPDSRYAASKAFGEAIAHIYSRKHGLAVTCIRIGHATSDASSAEPGNWIGPGDLTQLIAIALEHPAIAFETFHAVADHAGSRISDRRARRYGYRCLQPGETRPSLSVKLSAWFGPRGIARKYRGGYFAAAEHDSAGQFPNP
jgi:uronate dehydrogenase